MEPLSFFTESELIEKNVAFLFRFTNKKGYFGGNSEDIFCIFIPNTKMINITNINLIIWY